jgi:hypothetical protein
MHNKLESVAAVFLPVLLLCCLSGCATPRSETADTSEALVAPGDCLLIVFTHDPSIPCLRRVVDGEGDLHLPLNVKLNVTGMTLAQVEDAIPKRYVPCARSWKPSVFKAPK